MIAHLPTAAAVHVLDYDRGISRDIFAQKRNYGLYTVIPDSSWRGTCDDRYGFSLVKWRLSESLVG
jgi:hypothetical protein